MRACGRFDFRLGLRVALLAAAIGASLSAADAQQGPTSTLTIEVFGTTLRVRLPDGSIREGAALIGAVLVVAVGGRKLRVRIAGVERDTLDPSGEVWLYDFRQITADGGETPLCTPDPDGRQLGFPLAGRSDAAGMLRPSDRNEFELVCTSGAQGKCVRFGYAPWRQAPDGRPLRDWYNACVQMVRGDYCGDGRSFTRDGTWIDIYDRIGVQKSDNDPTSSFEAAWGPDGALCVARTRIPDIVDMAGLARACPRLAGRLGPSVCHENIPGVLILNRSR